MENDVLRFLKYRLYGFFRACLFKGKGGTYSLLARLRLQWGEGEGYLAAYLPFAGAMLQFSVLLLAGIMGLFCIVFSCFNSYGFSYHTKCLKDVSPKLWC